MTCPYCPYCWQFHAEPMMPTHADSLFGFATAPAPIIRERKATT